MSFEYSYEVVYQIWNDSTGERIEVGPDGDGLDLTEIRFRDEKGEIQAQIRLEDKQIPMLISILKAVETKDWRG